MGGHSSGLFPEVSNKYSNSVSSSSNNQQDNPLPKLALGLKNHLENFGGIGKTGINGCHKKTEFEKELESNGGIIEEKHKIEGINGVESVSYRLPKRSKSGEITNEFKRQIYVKSVYDSTEISTESFINRGMQAAENPIQTIGQKWTGIDHYGVKWTGYKNEFGQISTLYPVE